MASNQLAQAEPPGRECQNSNDSQPCAEFPRRNSFLLASNCGYIGTMVPPKGSRSPTLLLGLLAALTGGLRDPPFSWSKHGVSGRGHSQDK